MTIEVTKYKAVDKGAVMASIDIYIQAWDLEIRDIVLFRKDARKWVSMPSRMYEKDGEKKYFQYVRFRDKEKSDKFNHAVMKAVDEYCAKNSMSSGPVNHYQEEDIPF